MKHGRITRSSRLADIFCGTRRMVGTGRQPFHVPFLSGWRAHVIPGTESPGRWCLSGPYPARLVSPTTMSTNLYEILGVQANATPEQGVPPLFIIVPPSHELVLSPKGIQETCTSDTPRPCSSLGQGSGRRKISTGACLLRST